MAKKKTSVIESYKLKNGQTRYMFQIYIGTDPLTGKQQRTTRRNFKTKKEAELALARIKIEIDKGTFRKIQAETYSDIYQLWVKHYEKTVEESTFVKTEGIFRNHILPALGSYKIERMNVDICQRHVDEWATKLKKYRTVKSYAAKVLDFAIKRGYLHTNPFTLVEMPTKKLKSVAVIEEAEENFYNRDELVEFLSCLEKETNFKAYVFFRLLSYSGMRKGEALALTWKDLNFAANEIRIHKALSLGKDNQLYVKSTKTGIARNIKMDEKTMQILKEWKKKQKQDYLILGFNTLNKDQLVFSNTDNEFLQPTKTRKWLIYVQEKYSLKKISTHGLRHTHCSLLFEAGASIKEVQDRLGHSDVKTTMDIYTHVTQKAKEEAIQKFESYLKI
ncbi:site-specific integrase [Lysinibacillus fusiformis]|uniref:site-specific integrase n=1 Tax=Lysinibacillus fusiformis TaxID=28031 RepID=UPI00087E80B1|nr:site-specific integrase [Lysinibacillus fusiformis]SCX66892.1 Site-specific recombinase XerD [Lysinibacillus fusiformis]SDB41260.1 Site-specific recombinase XerD [Lysinibacillus fusiformis]SFI55536.1 Site-specific recombinase XerD [Lysinibacillus fusiformis]SFT24068.1 Site-specific recombinase XerD [Lysinibacillus fusiformis]